MTKVKKYNLSFENDYQYDLIGINSHHPDYRLVWNINQTFYFQLAKANGNYELFDKKGELKSFPYFYYQNEEDFLEVYLIKNKNQGKLLIPEKHQMDYFLFFCNNIVVDISESLSKLRKIDSVMIALPYKAKELESTKNIIFN
ncbi:MAG: IPExxxVDY family protein [Flavobacteriia bacterium]|nr:IPExxxVDY family protein [Flavobacteriia bacterium]